jgi:hypothetical protein
MLISAFIDRGEVLLPLVEVEEGDVAGRRKWAAGP